MTKYSGGALLLASAMLALATTHGAFADNPAEKEKLAQCAKEICSIIASKDVNGPDLACDLTKTWEKDEIQKGAESKKISWGLGSAKCTAKLAVKRADLVAAITSPENTLKIGKQPVSCEIGAEKYTVSATLAPELVFKDGTNTRTALHMDDIQGAMLIKGVVWTAATLEQNFGLFQSDLVREVNRFVHKECPKILSNAK